MKLNDTAFFVCFRISFCIFIKVLFTLIYQFSSNYLCIKFSIVSVPKCFLQCKGKCMGFIYCRICICDVNWSICECQLLFHLVFVFNREILGICFMSFIFVEIAHVTIWVFSLIHQLRYFRDFNDVLKHSLIYMYLFLLFTLLSKHLTSKHNTKYQYKNFPNYPCM